MTISREDFMGTTQAKSDQINAADLLGGPLVCQITDIQLTGSADQPISIYVDAHPQPWKPSKTSRRVLAACWADVEPSEWVGRYVVLYNDPTVMWAGKAEGGIRTSHLSHIDGKKTIMTNATRGKKTAQTVEPYYPADADIPASQPVFWPDEAFAKQLAKAQQKIDSGELTAEAFIASLEKKAPMTAGQKARVKPTPAPAMDEPEIAYDDDDPFGDVPPLGE